MPLRHVAPNPALMRELEQVSVDAEAVLEALASVNALPKDFPEQEISELCQSLRDLKDGTDEGSRSQLESARNRLPKWRRTHFHVEDEAEAEIDDVVRLYRDMHLDQRLGKLLISATTALDEYRAQISEHVDDTVAADETFTAAGNAGAATAMEQAVAVEASIGAAKSEIEQRLDPANMRVDVLKRRLTDGANLARTARSELRGRPIVRRWYKGVVAALEKTPELIIAAGNALQVGADVGLSLAEWWATFKKDPIRGIATAIRALGRALVEIGRRQAKHRDARQNATALRSFQDAPFAPEMVVLPAGSFLMGSPEGETGRHKPEGPQREVIVAGFAIGRYPVTFAEYDHFCEAAGWKMPDDESWGRGRMPVINVSWDDAVAYAVWLSEQTGKRYRLPSEAEWEYACRAGTATAYWWGDDFNAKKANTEEGGPGRTTEVGSYPANPWGLFDTLGNVSEWVEDHWHDTYEGAPPDTQAWLSTPAGTYHDRVCCAAGPGAAIGAARAAPTAAGSPQTTGSTISVFVLCVRPPS